MGAWRGNVYGRAEQILFVIRLRFPLSSLRHDLHQKKKGLHLPRNLILLHFLLFLLDQILFFFLGSGIFLLSTRHFSNVSSLFSTTDDEGMSARTTHHAPRTTHRARGTLCLLVTLTLMLYSQRLLPGRLWRQSGCRPWLPSLLMSRTWMTTTRGAPRLFTKRLLPRITQLILLCYR